MPTKLTRRALAQVAGSTALAMSATTGEATLKRDFNMKYYVICMDGTWNVPGQIDKDPLSGTEYLTETNVFRVFRGLTGVSPDQRTPYGQTSKLFSEVTNGEAIYFSGVGTEPGTRVFEGITGLGIGQRIMDAYQFLAGRYRTGDKIFGFGFSRGAFAIRSLAGLIQHVGLPDKPQPLTANDVEELYEQYGSRNTLAEPSMFSHRFQMVDFLGLWDTVGALTGDNTNHYINSSNVLRVVHALALDEQRDDFTPEYWIAQDGFSNSNLVKEVWFSGAHSNVGGGYVDDNLSNIAFFWVMKEAQTAGLDISLPSMPWWVRENAGGILGNYALDVLSRDMYPMERRSGDVEDSISLEKAIEKLSRALYYKMESLDPSGHADWDSLDELDKDFYDACVREILRNERLILSILRDGFSSDSEVRRGHLVREDTN